LLNARKAVITWAAENWNCDIRTPFPIDRKLENINIANLRLKLLAEDLPQGRVEVSSATPTVWRSSSLGLRGTSYPG